MRQTSTMLRERRPTASQRQGALPGVRPAAWPAGAWPADSGHSSAAARGHLLSGIAPA